MGQLEPDNGELKVELERGGDGSVLVRLAGELDIATVPGLEAAVAPAIAEAPPRLVIDAGRLEFADSSAIALWLKWANAVPELEIREPSQMLVRVITRMGLAERLRLAPPASR